MQTADYNHNDFSNTAEADKALMVKFFYKNVENKMESQAQGRPVFKEKTYIEIRIAGQRDAQACRPVTHSDKMRFPAHFEAFEKRMEPPTEGMPLAEWPQISRSQAEELSFLHIKTVEQLATVKDGNMQNFMGGYALREKAQKWLELNDAETVDREKEEMRAELAEIKAQMATLLANTPEAYVNATNVTSPAAIARERIAANITDHNALLQTPAAIASELDEDVVESPVEGAAVEVPAAPAARPRTRRKRT